MTVPAVPGMPDVHAAEPIPEVARAALAALFETGDLFRYTSEDAPVAALEREFAAKIGSRHALAVSSCSAALFLALKALDLPRGTRVLVPAFTFAAVPSAVIHADCVPVLVEVGADLRIDLDDFAVKLDGAGAVMISHMRGHTSDMDAILALAGARGLPVIEDAAHSLGTTWAERPIGTLGRIGCFSFQSYKMLNAGEGGMLVSDEPDLIARAVIMSGAYEHNWKKHGLDPAVMARWQNRLPLYNMRMANLAAAVLRAQLDDLDHRVAQGRANHDRVAADLAATPWFHLPAALPKEVRAPDSLQFSLRGFTDAEAADFLAAATARGVTVQIFGMSPDNARAFWNWRFLGEVPDLPRTRAMLMRTCDLRLPARLTPAETDSIAGALILAAEGVKRPRAYGT